MIRHVVFFSAKNKNDVDAVIAGLSVLKTNPHADKIEISRNLHADELTGGMVDVIVYAEFADESQLAAYKAHPVYQQSIAMVRPLRELRIAADFIA
jgi:stress responsive alpha/beta barrel protein